MSTNQFGKKGWTPDRIKDLKGKTFVITGTTSGTGFEAAKMESEYALTVFPNPATNTLTVRCKDPAIVHLDLCDLQGRIILSIDIGSRDQTINITNLSSGIFVILGKNVSNITKYQQRCVKQ